VRVLESIRALHVAAVLLRRGWSPATLGAIRRSQRQLGACLAASFVASAARRPDAQALLDERGALCFEELSDQILRTATGLASRGIGPESRVALLCRNHRDFVIGAAAAGVLRARLILLNTASAAPEIGRVVRRENVELLIHDCDLGDAVSEVPPATPRVLAWTDGATPDGVVTLDQLGSGAERLAQPPTRRPTDAVILTSGTTGAPRGALRSGNGPSRLSLVRMLERFPVRLDGSALLAAPLFHTWGLAMLNIAAMLSNTLILQRRSDARQVLAALAQHRPDLFVATPPVLQRMVELPAELRAAHDTSSLRIAASSGAALTGNLATRWMECFGRNLYCFYGSTELHVVAFATPDDLAAAPSTVGRPVPEVEVRVVDAAGREVAPHVVGRVVVRSPSRFAGYTDGSAGASEGDMLVTRDLGHFDERGRLYIDGREDDVVVSGGEKVLPGEVEDLLSQHPEVLEVAVIGVSDSEFGQRLKAFVVPRPGAHPLEGDLKGYVRERLARYKVPRDVELVAELPRTDTGKILRRLLGSG
jgi:fatty-acyl-CoA synthase